MRIFRDGAYGIIRAAEMAWPKEEKQRTLSNSEDEPAAREKNIFELARNISYRAQSRRQLRRSAGIL